MSSEFIDEKQQEVTLSLRDLRVSETQRGHQNYKESQNDNNGESLNVSYKDVQNQGGEKPLYKLAKIPGKGEGLVAAMDLEPGTDIMEEAPFFVIDGKLADFDRIQNILLNFGNMSAQDQAAYLKLYDPEDLHVNEYLRKFPEFHEEAEMRKIVRIFDLNSYEVCVDQTRFGIDESGLYPTIPKINHSCCPNVVWTWVEADPSHRVHRVTVATKILEGEEILISYIPLATFPSRAERRAKLAAGWYFECDCPVCGLEGEARAENEALRSRIRDHDDQHSYLVARAKVKEALAEARQKVHLMETLGDEAVLTLPFALLELSSLASHQGFTTEAKEAGERARLLAATFGDRHLAVFDLL